MCPGAPRGGCVRGHHGSSPWAVLMPQKQRRSAFLWRETCWSWRPPVPSALSLPHTQEHPEPCSSCKTLGEQVPSLLSEQNFRSYPVSEHGKDDPRTQGLCNAEGEQRAVFTLSFPGGSSPSAVGMTRAPACRALGLPQTRE